MSSARDSKSSRHAGARLRNIFHKLRKILYFERETVKITSFNLILLILTHFSVYYVLSGTFSCANIFWPDIMSAQDTSLLESLGLATEAAAIDISFVVCALV